MGNTSVCTFAIQGLLSSKDEMFGLLLLSGGDYVYVNRLQKNQSLANEWNLFGKTI